MHPNDTTNEIPYGYCQCGCGQKTRIATATDKRAGWIKGQPKRFISGHNSRKYSAEDGPNPGGLCMCGCGQPAPIARESKKGKGKIEGQPLRYIVGHNPKKRIEREGEQAIGDCACGCGTPIYASTNPNRQALFAPGHTGRWTMTVQERFWSKVDRRGTDDCWEWTASTTDFGYGTLGIGGRNGSHALAHRFSWELHFGPIPEDMQVLHKCDNPPCVNPKHLFLGTQDDNIQDMMKKGRSKRYPEVLRTQVCALYAAGISQTAVAKQLGIGQTTVSRIIQEHR